MAWRGVASAVAAELGRWEHFFIETGVTRSERSSYCTALILLLYYS